MRGTTGSTAANGKGDSSAPAKEHELKCWPQHFVAVMVGVKQFEIRKDDRQYRVGDTLRLREWDPDAEVYTGRERWCDVTYVLRNSRWMLPGYVAISIANVRSEATSAESQPDVNAVDPVAESHP